MKEINLLYVKNTNITEPDLICSCGEELDIFHNSILDNGIRGIFYTRCPECGREYNKFWKNTTPRPIDENEILTK